MGISEKKAMKKNYKMISYRFKGIYSEDST